MVEDQRLSMAEGELAGIRAEKAAGQQNIFGGFRKLFSRFQKTVFGSFTKLFYGFTKLFFMVSKKKIWFNSMRIIRTYN